MPVLNFDVLWKDRGAQRGLTDLGNAAEESASKFGDFKETIGIAAAGAGVAAGGLLTKSFVDNLDLESGRAKLAGQLGLTKEESSRIGKVAGSLYAAGYGESMADVNDTLKGVIENIDGMRTASDETLAAITKKVSNLQNTTGETSEAISRAVSQMLRTGMAESADEALNIVTAGFQRGANKSEDFLDTLNEYGTQFRKLGIDGAEATGIISQGLQAGARDADIVADAIKEFFLRSQGAIKQADGNGGFRLTAMGQALADIGIQGDAAFKWQEDIAEGGPEAQAALDLVLDRMREMPDSTQKATDSVALFGTQAEDLGAALYAIDPSEATKALGDVGSAAENLDKTLRDTGQQTIEQYRRSFEQWTQSLAGAEGPMGDLTAGVVAFGAPALAMGAQVATLAIGLSTLNGSAVLATASTAALAVKQAFIATVTGAWSAAQWLLNAALVANPIGLVVVGLVALAAGLVVAYKKSETFREIVDAAFKAVGTVLGWYWEYVKFVFGAVVAIWDTMSDAFSGGADMIARFIKQAGRTLMQLPEKGKEMITGLGNRIVNTGAWLYKQVNKVISKTIDLFNGAPRWLVSAGKKIVTGLWNGWSSLNQWFAGRVANFILSARNKFSNARNWLTSAGSNIVRGLWSGVSGRVSSFLTSMSSFISRIRDRFGNARNWLFSSGKNLLLGLKDGMAEAVKGAGQWARDVGSRIVSAVKSYFGIRSPSRVFMEIGGHLIGGLVKGLVDSNPTQIIPKIFGSMPKALEALVDKGLVSIKNLPAKAANALIGLGGSIAGKIAGQFGGGDESPRIGGLSAAESWIIMRESGNRTTAQNPTSSAFGLGQLIYANRVAYGSRIGVDPNTTDYSAQLRMFRMYVAERYGTAENAKAFWQANGWYDNGGVANGVGYMAKNTLEPERVLSPRQTRAFESLVSVLTSNPAGGVATPGVDYGRLASAVVSAFLAANVSVRMDGNAVGRVMGKQAHTLGRV